MAVDAPAAVSTGTDWHLLQTCAFNLLHTWAFIYLQTSGPTCDHQPKHTNIFIILTSSSFGKVQEYMLNIAYIRVFDGGFWRRFLGQPEWRYKSGLLRSWSCHQHHPRSRWNYGLIFHFGLKAWATGTLHDIWWFLLIFSLLLLVPKEWLAPNYCPIKACMMVDDIHQHGKIPIKHDNDIEIVDRHQYPLLGPHIFAQLPSTLRDSAPCQRVGRDQKIRGFIWKAQDFPLGPSTNICMHTYPGWERCYLPLNTLVSNTDEIILKYHKYEV